MNITTRLQDTSTLDEAQQLLGEMINLGQPASPLVTQRALVDPQYAFYLETTQHIPELQDKLLRDPRNETFGSEGHGGVGITDELRSVVPKSGNIELISRATKAFVGWGKTGFRLAEKNLVDARLKACGQCEFLTDPPKTVIYQGIQVVTGKDEKICSACGCFIKRKAKVPSEKCPKQDPNQPSFSRWGDTWKT